ncbi:unnamed protein product [Brachionus calyciflorus]|uniref:Uncharacterized protein n=1 Tax=Brachionus calyciflorus TaxID=104777 RepID=A0A813MLZ4_9BILA|nr:unnamed protein product [Brachionus calyciflorus]
MSRKPKANNTKIILLNRSISENKEHLLSDWCKYFSNLLNNESPSNKTNYPEPSDDNIEINTEPLSFKEVEEAVRTFKNNKTPGNDILTSDILKEGGDFILRKLHLLINIVYEHRSAPEQWTTGLIAPLPKKGQRSGTFNKF